MQKKILVVDDNESVLVLIKEVCRLAKIKTISFSNPKNAYQYWLEHKDEIGVVISDIDMPELNGIDLFWMLREGDIGVRIILITADTGELDKEREEILKPLFNHPNIAGVFKKPFLNLRKFKEVLQKELNL